jgi:sporulation protein YlmC with PRC-barrel domain
MLEEVSDIIGLQVYTPDGIFLGNVNNLLISLDECAVDGVYIEDTNPILVEDSKPVVMPYRWIQSVGDVVVLRFFPKRIGSVKRADDEGDEVK